MVTGEGIDFTFKLPCGKGLAWVGDDEWKIGLKP